jgi:tagatose 6-phosphate kinase
MSAAPYVLCVTLNPVLDTTYFVNEMRPVYRTEASRVTHIAGGKGNNVARALGMLGVKAHSLVALGGMIGRNVAEVWKADPFEATPVWTSGETRLQITVIDARGTQRAFYAPPAEFTREDAERFSAVFDLLVSAAQAVCVCGSSPGPAADRFYGRFLSLARNLGSLTVLDTYGEALRQGLTARPRVVKVNRAEAEGFLGCKLADAAAERGAVTALRRAGAEIAVLTLGERGALLASGDDVWHAEPPQVEALNPIGSGDAMTAGIVAALVRGEPPVDAFRLGMAAAAANTLTWDACRFDPEEVGRLVSKVHIGLAKGETG